MKLTELTYSAIDWVVMLLVCSLSWAAVLVHRVLHCLVSLTLLLLLCQLRALLLLVLQFHSFLHQWQ